MNFEAGKFYKTRDGRKARIYATDTGVYFSVHGAVEIFDNLWQGYNWTAQGNLLFSNEHELDLVSPWE